MHLTTAGKRFLLIWSLMGIVLAIVTAFLYLTWSGFGEQGEVNFAAVSWLLYNGHPLYTDVASADRYSLQHGPIVYLITGGVMKVLGPTYITAKLSGIIMLLLSLLVSFFWFSKLTSKSIAVCLLGLEVWILFHWHNSFYIRPDSTMLLCVISSMYIVTTVKHRMTLILGTAISLGILVNLKIHGILYFVPIMSLLYRRLNIKELFSIGGLALLFGAIPFLLPQISLENYIIWIRQSVYTEVQDPAATLRNFWSKLLIIAELCLVPISIGVIRNIDLRDFYNRNKMLINTTLLSLFIVSIIGSKPGSGTNHLMPFMPIYCYILLLLVTDTRDKGSLSPTIGKNKFREKLCYMIVALVLLSITSSAIGKEIGLLKPIFKYDRTALLQELSSIEALYKGKTMEIGYGEVPNRAVSDCIPLLVFHGNPLLIERVALGDMITIGMPIPPVTIRQIADGKVQVWLIPAGNTPFWGFEERFRQAVIENYSLAFRMKFFDVWVHKSIK